MRRTLPRRAARGAPRGLCDAVMAHWRLVSPALVAAVADAGGELYVWTVDHAPRIRELEPLGVTGVITNDPRLFGPQPRPRPNELGGSRGSRRLGARALGRVRQHSSRRGPGCAPRPGRSGWRSTAPLAT